MLNNRFIVVILILTIVIGTVIGGILFFDNHNKQDLYDDMDEIEHEESTAHNVDTSDESMKIEEETNAAITSTPFVDIEEGNEIYFDADVVEKLSLLHDEGKENLVNDMLDWISGFINHYAAKGYSYKAICQVQRLFWITAEDMMKQDFEITCLNITRCIPSSGANKSTFEYDMHKVFEWSAAYDYSYVFELEVME